MVSKRLCSAAVALALLLSLFVIPTQAVDVPEERSWDLTAGVDALPKFEGDSGAYEGIHIDAQNGKFAPRDNDTQIAAGTILYIPVAANANGAVLTISLSGNSTTVEVGGQEYTFSGSKGIPLEASAADFYCAVSFQAESYLSSISLTYSAAPEDYPGTPDGVAAVDTAWDLTQGATVLPTVQSERADYAGIRIDASAGKFAPRDGDTQINGGTILYIPVAADPSGVVLTVTGNNYNNLTITLDGEPLKVGVETSLAAAQNGYLALSFSGEGSCYLTGITVDYLSDVPEVRPSTVTVGPDGACDYTSIQAALDANPSSQETPLTILIAPGTYTEKVTVQDPYVTFQALSGGDVVIQEQYYSSNRYDQNGVYWPVDEYDVGTATCGTVIVESTASNFSAVGITFRNTYNLTVATAAGEQTPAVALHTKADKVYLKDCTLEGRQDM